jgi:hypothetical protein
MQQYSWNGDMMIGMELLPNVITFTSEFNYYVFIEGFHSPPFYSARLEWDKLTL